MNDQQVSDHCELLNVFDIARFFEEEVDAWGGCGA